jgi:hypothetical protein
MMQAIHLRLKWSMWSGVRNGLEPATVISIGKNVLKGFGHEKFSEISDLTTARLALNKIESAIGAAVREKQK